MKPLFAEGSYGYRPNKVQKDAILKVKDMPNKAKHLQKVLDLSKYFDTL